MHINIGTWHPLTDGDNHLKWIADILVTDDEHRVLGRSTAQLTFRDYELNKDKPQALASLIAAQINLGIEIALLHAEQTLSAT